MVKPVIGSIVGSGIALLVAPWLKRFFSVPDGGVGYVTIAGYPKGWDHAAIALLIVCAFIGGALGRATPDDVAIPRKRTWPLMLIVFVLMFLAHDHPNAPLDMFHEGEHVTPAYLMREGARPYRDFFVLHGLGVDGGIDLIGPPRKVQAVLDAAVLALLVPIAAELTATPAGMIAAVFLSICMIGAGQVPVFPYHRLWPVLVATLALLRFVRTGKSRDLALAFCAGTLGVIYGLDTGTYALAGTIGVCVLLRIKRAVLPAAIAVVIAVVVLIAIRADISQFLTDSFVHIPRTIDAVWALPAPPYTNVHYWLPPAFYGFLLAYALHAWRGGRRELAARIVVVAVLSIVAFRTASGRVSWSHTRFAIPLFGIAAVAFVIEPLRRQRWIALPLAIGMIFLVDVGDNLERSTKLIGGWRARQTARPADPDLPTLRTFIHSVAPPGATIFDFSNERAVYALVRRKPATRVFDVPMLSSPVLLAEAMRELEANRPAAVIVEGNPVLFNFDQVSNRTRVPALAEWIDRNYPMRTQIGRFIVATP